MEGNLLWLFAAGAGAAVMWGDPEGMVSRNLGFGPRLRLCAGLAFIGIGAALWALPAHRAAGPADQGASWGLLRLTDGKATNFAEFRGRPVLLNLWPLGAAPAWAKCPR